MGNVFHHMIAHQMNGANRKQRLAALHDLIRAYYDNHPEVHDRLVGLRGWGVKPKGDKTPKLRCSAACARALIPFCDETCQALLSDADPIEQAMKIGSHHLHECYKCLSKDHGNWRTVLKTSSKNFCIQYHALERTSGSKAWKVKPKMHHFLEMTNSGSKPNMSWTYRDEDYGGSIAQLCRIKGGCWKKVRAYSSKMLVLFKTKNRAPRIK